jgi:soluble lytic murein transglycosylase
MTAHAASRTRRRGRRQAVARRRMVAIAAAALVGGGLAWAALPEVERGVQELTLPLRHEDVIRQQAADKGLDPALIAAVIYAESRFVDQTSSAGARGLMQITPQTADAIAQRTGGYLFRQEDLATPQVNISYGSWYLAHLLRHYEGDEVLALAADNAGSGNVDRWRAERGGGTIAVGELPFAETRSYVERVLDARRDYRSKYSRELGL